jgi:hypothetical protein
MRSRNHSMRGRRAAYTGAMVLLAVLLPGILLIAGLFLYLLNRALVKAGVLPDYAGIFRDARNRGRTDSAFERMIHLSYSANDRERHRQLMELYRKDR